ncbi:MAG TPA: peptidoglycan editing factor PgeF [Pyrinomonadaceae bacterium]|nr:peptidoglycan editing factor PgeF [Pyrinomonadaceae bacterium]
MATIIDEKKLQHAGFYWRETEGVKALVCSGLEADGFTNGFSTRVGGISLMPDSALNLAGFNEDAAENILENRRRFLKLFPGHWNLAGCWQVHGKDIRVVADAIDAKPAENALGDTVYCDALVSDAAEVLLGVKTADCVPLLMGDPRTGAFAAVHAGWRGTVAGVATIALARLAGEYGVRPPDVRVAIGPAAAGCCYEVGSDVIDAFKTQFPESDSLFVSTRPGHARVNLLQANHDQLAKAGVSPERIHTAPFCTMCRTDLFFSYRREKTIQGKVGRLMSVIGRAPELEFRN